MSLLQRACIISHMDAIMAYIDRKVAYIARKVTPPWSEGSSQII